MLCTNIVLNVKTKTKKQFLYTTCSELVFFGEFNEQSLVILWVNWCKNEGFWKRFTCNSKASIASSEMILQAVCHLLFLSFLGKVTELEVNLSIAPFMFNVPLNLRLWEFLLDKIKKFVYGYPAACTKHPNQSYI